MPRKRKTQSGDDAQSIASVPGQRYGEGVEQQQMQQTMPAPVRSELPPVAAPSANHGAPAVDTSLAAGAPPPTPEQLMQMLRQAPLNQLASTSFPNQPVTAGLSTGPGAGPNALGAMRPYTSLGRTMRQLSQQTGDPFFDELADRAGI